MVSESNASVLFDRSISISLSHFLHIDFIRIFDVYIYIHISTRVIYLSCFTAAML